MKKPNRGKLLKIMLALYGEAVNMGLPNTFLEDMDRDIVENSNGYDPANEHKKWMKGNNRYVYSIVGVQNEFLYAMHLWKTLPPWMDVQLLGDKDDQCRQKIDVRVDEGEGFPKRTIQIKTGHEGKSNDIYGHYGWPVGASETLVAVCVETRAFHIHTLGAWSKLMAKAQPTEWAWRGSNSVWISRTAFLSSGGTIESFHPDLVKILETV